METIKVKAKAIKETFANGDYRIFSWMPLQTYEDIQLSPYMCFSTKGETPYITEGKEYELELELIKHDSKWGDSFKIVDVPSMRLENLSELTREQQFEMLMDITSSERIANNILDAYPNFFEIILTKGKQDIDLKKIHGVGEKYLSAYERDITVKYKYLGLISKLKDYKVDIDDCKKLFEKYITEYEIQKALEKNPYYVLVEVLQRTFDISDKIILNLKKELHDSNIRCEAIMLDILRRNEQDGSSLLQGNILWEVCKEDYQAPQKWTKTIKDIAINSDQIYYNEETKDLARMQTYIGECMIANFVKEKLKNSKELDIDCEKYRDTNGFRITDSQMNLLKNFCKYNFSLLAGVAGGGKSSAVKSLVNLMEDNRISYTLLSSTGKASKVLSESTGRKSMTIHKRCFTGKIDSDCVVVDECGMVNLDTFIMLLNAITNENCRIVLIADPCQLSPIGLSKVFDDLFKSEIVPYTYLTEVFRYKSDGSLFVASNVREGNFFFDDKEMVKEKDNCFTVGNNYKFINCEEDKIADMFISEYKKLIDKGIKPKDIMGLSPFNKGELGTYCLNNLIQAEINPPKPNEKIQTKTIGGYDIVFREGDIVINTKNDYEAISYEAYQSLQEEPMLNEKDVADSIVVNGQTGIVRNVLDNGLVIQFDEDLIFYNKYKLQNLLLSYVISMHKSQGSSVDYVISIISEKHKKMLTRGLLYVADTRCRKGCVDIGSINCFNNALKIVDNDLRNTFLKELLING